MPWGVFTDVNSEVTQDTNEIVIIMIVLLLMILTIMIIIVIVIMIVIMMITMIMIIIIIVIIINNNNSNDNHTVEYNMPCLMFNCHVEYEIISQSRTKKKGTGDSFIRKDIPFDTPQVFS